VPTKPSELRSLVRESYDRIAERYLKWRAEQHREDAAAWVSIISERLPAGSGVLDLGCGAGIPLTKALAGTFHVTGLDISPRQIELARRCVPNAHFVNADIVTHDFTPESFDGAVASYSLFHIPRAEHEGLFQKIATWLRRGGLLLANFGIGNVEVDYEEDWLGAPMIWSSFDEDRARAVLKKAGFELVIDRVEREIEDGKPHKSLFVLLRR
jgi:SAM-dependent methyltransferase